MLSLSLEKAPPPLSLKVRGSWCLCSLLRVNSSAQ
uniref:Uncharacterized protein n=1 Tax=Anguilla anguilla TaxID=7936 RepID=A0A0E9UEY9_ANGAN